MIKYRISGSQLGSTNQSASSSSSSGSIGDTYPSSAPALYPEPSSTQTRNHPMLTRFVSVNTIMAAAQSTEDIPAAIEEMRQVLRRQHALRADKEDDFEVRDMAEMTNTLSSTTRLMTNLLLCVATISLVVGGVGIMNIMLVSVTERTREIGLRMAVGARSRDILRQFLSEAVLLCLTGGAMGIALGHGGSLLVRLLLHWPVRRARRHHRRGGRVRCRGHRLRLLPAWKASRLDPIGPCATNEPDPGPVASGPSQWSPMMRHNRTRPHHPGLAGATLLLAGLALLTGCRWDLSSRPQTSLPTTWTSPAPPGTDALAQWWTTFNDAT